MSVEPDFNSVSEADAAYYGDGSGDDGGDDPGNDPTSSTRWGEVQKIPTDWRGGWVLSYQAALDEDRRRFFVTRSKNGNLQALTETGEPTGFSESTPADEIPHFPTEEEARAAYQAWAEKAENGGPEDGDDSPTDGWTEYKEVEKVGVWMLYQREKRDGTDTQWTAAGQNGDGDVVFLMPDGTVGDSPNHYADRAAVEAAIEKFNEKARNGEVPEEDVPVDTPSEEEVNNETKSGDGEAWTEWQRIDNVQNWTIWGREHQSEDRVQFLVASTNQSGDAIYLQPEGEVAKEAHIFESVQAVRDALDAYATRRENGEVPEGKRPTGNSPSREQVRRDAAKATEGSSGGLPGPVGAVVDAVGGPRNAAILAVAGTAGVYYAEREGMIDLSGRFG